MVSKRLLLHKKLGKRNVKTNDMPFYKRRMLSSVLVFTGTENANQSNVDKFVILSQLQVTALLGYFMH